MAELRFQSPRVRVEVDGEVTTLRLGLEGLAKLQELWELPTLQDLQEKLGKMQVADMADLLFVAMLFDQPTTTRAQGKAFANSMALPDLMQTVQAVVASSRPPAEANQARPTRATTRNRRR